MRRMPAGSMAASGRKLPVVFPKIHQSERPLLRKADIDKGMIS